VKGLTTHLRHSKAFAAITAATVVLAVACIVKPTLRGDTAFDAPTERDAVTISAAMSQEWTEGSVRISLLHGQCRIGQGDTVLRARKMVVFHETDSSRWDKRDRLTVYLEDDVRIDRPGQSVTKSVMVVHLVTRAGLTHQIRSRAQSVPARRDDPLYRRAEKRVRHGRRHAMQPSAIRQTQLLVPGSDPTDPEFRSVQIQSPSGSLRRVRISPRSAVSYNILSFESTATTPPEQVVVITGGVNILIDGVGEYGTVDLSADRMVIWRQSSGSKEFESESIQSRDAPFQVYMEGNIVIRQGGDPTVLPGRSTPDLSGNGGPASEEGLSFVEQQRRGQLGEIVLRGTQAVYDAREDRALLLNAELKTYIPRIQGNIRIRAERIRQHARNSFHAERAWVSGSQFAKPGYRVQSSDIYLEPRIVNPWVGPQGNVDPITGQPIVTEVPWITSLNNTFLVGDVPLFYSPFFAAPADQPNVPLRRATVGHDSILGGKFETVWNMFMLLGLEEPAGVRWDLYADYFTERGPAFGMGTEYTGQGLFGLPGTYAGNGLIYGIHDSGNDVLGTGRNSLMPKDEARGRILLRHRHFLPANASLIAEIGLISDRNYLEQFNEREFDNGKDNETLLYLKQDLGNFAWSILARPQLNDFENTTEWLPRGDLYLFSEPLLNGLLTWSSHTSAGYGNLEPSVAPSDPNDLFNPLPFVADVGGAVLMSRHELRMPFSVGPVNLVPFVMGEAAVWGEGFDGNSIDRFVGSAGVRSSLLIWRTYPFVSSRVFNLNGLAHKIRLEAEYALTESTRDLAEIPQYNEFDDNAQERFRQRLITNTFGGRLPAVFEPRGYAVRTGAGSSLMSPYHELVDDQQVVRLALRQRLQTKVGPPDRLRIRDWMRLDLEASFFPKANRDNFGEDVGLLGGQYQWNFGDRTRLEASTYFDLFDNAQELWNIGLHSQRTSRGSVYMGVRQVKGAGLDSQILTCSYSYSMGPKWFSTAYTAYDLGETRNAGQGLVITRIGADFLIHLGVNYDESKENAGIALSIEPRFGLFNGSSGGGFGSLMNATNGAP
jgi:lipopolysaccharide export system protein LptA